MTDGQKDGLILGGMVVIVLILAVFMANFESNKVKDCKAKGGVLIKANNDRVCVKLERL